LIHRLLQVLPDLPPAARPDALRRFLAAPLHRLDDQARTRIAAEVSAILDDTTFAPVFGPGSRAEVALVGAVDGAIVSGQVDRLVVAEDSVLLIDFKSDRSPPPAASAVAPFYLRQLRLYREVLRAIFPGKTVQSALLWTDGPLLMPIADHLLDSAK
jgi:ATP-dependent helicase/nuclease subunit A